MSAGNSIMNYKHTHKTGFTIVELLIVIVVIGILAAITIVAYNGIQNRALVTRVSTDLSGAAKQFAIFEVDAGRYPTTLSEANNGQGIKASTGTTYQYTASGSAYCLTATNGTISYKISNTATTPTLGGCAGHGVGGSAAITNIATNPGAEVNTAGMSGTVARATDWASSGSASFIVTPGSASNDTYIAYGGDLGGFRMGLQAGKTYTISGKVRLTAPLAGTFSGNGSRQITAWYTTAGGSHVRTPGSQAANSAGETRVDVTYSIPADATAAWIRLYNGTSLGNGSVWWDDIMITEGSTAYNYADGNTANWVWNGTTNNSTSTGSPL